MSGIDAELAYWNKAAVVWNETAVKREAAMREALVELDKVRSHFLCTHPKHLKESADLGGARKCNINAINILTAALPKTDEGEQD